MVLFLSLFFISSGAFATVSAVDLFDKTFPRDNSFCQIGKNRVEIMLRGENRYTEPKEKKWGEHAFIVQGKKKIFLKLSQEQSGYYKFLKGSNTLCTKSDGYEIDDKTFAALFVKDNRPHTNKLVIQKFDLSGFPGEVIHTNYLTDKTYFMPNGFLFRTYPERLEMDMGKFTKDGTEYTYQDRKFPFWMSYTGKGFSPEPQMTFQHFPYRRYFKDESDFLKAAGWSKEQGTFLNRTLYFAVNMKARKKCVLLLPSAQKLNGSEAWVCR